MTETGEMFHNVRETVMNISILWIPRVGKPASIVEHMLGLSTDHFCCRTRNRSGLYSRGHQHNEPNLARACASLQSMTATKGGGY